MTKFKIAFILFLCLCLSAKAQTLLPISSVTTSSSPAQANNLIDGSISTSWSSSAGTFADEFVVLTLNNQSLVSKIILSYSSNFLRPNVNIYLSSTSTFSATPSFSTTVPTAGAVGAASATIILPSTPNVKYIKIACPSNGSGNPMCFSEIAVYGLSISDGNFNNLNVFGNSYFAGNIGIGTSTPTNKLEVNGTIRCKEVDVEASPWPDYVFGPKYHLMSLNELDAYIRANNHLPGVPSAQEVDANGVKLGELNSKLMQKVEEMTLYVIALKKEVDELKQQNAIQQKK